jgi:hypothetical protein
MVLIPGHGKYTTAQKVVMEAKLGRRLRRDEVSHHIDENKLNNDPANLDVHTRKTHPRLHAQMKKEMAA